MFVRLKDGRAVRIDDVAVVGPLDEMTVELRLKNGAEHRAATLAWVWAVSLHTARFIPAEPRTYRLVSDRDHAGEFWHSREPVIGWALDDEGELRPVTFDGSNPEEFYTVLMPDGSVQGFESSWSSFDHWLEDERSKYAPPPPPPSPPPTRRRGKLKLVE